MPLTLTLFPKGGEGTFGLSPSGRGLGVKVSSRQPMCNVPRNSILAEF